MIKAVVFDLGKVLVDFDYGIAIRKIAARGKLTASQIASHVNQAPLLIRYETGHLSSAEFFAEVCEVTGYCGNLDEFACSFGDIFSPIEPMITMHRALRQRGLPTYIFSNTNDLAVRHIRNTFPFFADFDGYILSYEHRLMKPDPAFYAVVERESGRSGAEILYLDDRPENIAAGAALGWHAVLHETPEKSRAVVRELLGGD